MKPHECPNPNTCDGADHTEPTIDWDRPHHYGCECPDCIEWYRRLKS